MTVKIDIKLFDGSTIESLEKVGVTPTFLKIYMKQAFSCFLDGICEDKGVNYTLSVDVEENITD